MTDQNFQVPPPPPQAPAFAPQPQHVKAEVVVDAMPITEASLPADHLAARFKLSSNIYKTKVLGGILIGTLVVGVVLGSMLFGGSSAPQKAVPTGLNSFVVRNPDISSKENLKRCGVPSVSVSAPCILYIMNHTRNDRLAGSFFEEAARLTGRQEFRIRIDNGQYSTYRIEGGRIAQIKIPPLN